MAVADKSFGDRVKAIQPTAPGPDPQIAFIVLCNGEDAVMTDGIGIVRIMLKDLKGISIVTVQSILGTDPKVSLAILKYG